MSYSEHIGPLAGFPSTSITCSAHNRNCRPTWRSCREVIGLERGGIANQTFPVQQIRRRAFQCRIEHGLNSSPSCRITLPEVCNLTNKQLSLFCKMFSLINFFWTCTSFYRKSFGWTSDESSVGARIKIILDCLL